MKKLGKSNSTTRMLLGPYSVWAAIFIIVPLIFIAYYAFTDNNFNFTLENITKFFTATSQITADDGTITEVRTYIMIFMRSLKLAIISTVICLLMGYPLAYIMARAKERTQKILEQCVGDAHMNMLRVWGGGIYPPHYFFDICDSLGILVWQDFMFIGSTYPYTDAYLSDVREEAEEQVIRLKNHPSLALWCGNNEISEGYYNWGWQNSMGWSDEEYKEMKDGYDKLFEDLLDDVVKTNDKSRPYWPSSPHQTPQ